MITGGICSVRSRFFSITAPLSLSKPLSRNPTLAQKHCTRRLARYFLASSPTHFHYYSYSRSHSFLQNPRSPSIRVANSPSSLIVCDIDNSSSIRNRRRVSSMSSSAGLVQFPLSPSSVLKIQKGDITQWFVDGKSDAIVNPANERMLGGGGADGAIHRAAGPELKEACYKVPEVRPGVRCPTGEARITSGFKLPAAYVIHTVGPIYDHDKDPEALLRNSYRNSLRVAKENNVQYIAFPAISCGVYRYPFNEAATIAISTVKEVGTDLKEVHFVLFSDDIYDVWVEKANELVEK